MKVQSRLIQNSIYYELIFVYYGVIGCRCFRKPKFSPESYMPTNQAFVSLKKPTAKKISRKLKMAVKSFIFRAKKLVLQKTTAMKVTANTSTSMKVTANKSTY